MTKVTILMATHNPNYLFLKSAIDSILQQSFSDFKLLIIDDYSRENITTILESISKDKRIYCIRNSNNLGLTHSLNIGLSKSKTQYIARIDDDDIWSDPNKLEKQINFMENHPDYVLCGTNVINIDVNGKQLGDQVKTREQDQNIRDHILQSNQFAHSSIIMRTSALKEAGGKYNPNYKVSQDYELWCRLGRIGKFYNLQNSFISYRVHNKSATSKNRYNQKKMSFRTCINNRYYYPFFLKAVFFRSVDFCLPEKVKNFILKILKTFNFFE